MWPFPSSQPPGLGRPLQPLTLSHMSSSLIFQAGGVSDACFFSWLMCRQMKEIKAQLLCAKNKALCISHIFLKTLEKAPLTSTKGLHL